jgi:hypothetical protein
MVWELLLRSICAVLEMIAVNAADLQLDKLGLPESAKHQLQILLCFGFLAEWKMICVPGIGGSVWFVVLDLFSCQEEATHQV